MKRNLVLKIKIKNMGKINHWMLRKFKLVVVLVLSILVAGGIGTVGFVWAASTSNFTQTINQGTLSVDIVDDSWVTVGSPAVAMSDSNFSLTCLTAGNRPTGTFGTDTQRIYVTNPDANDGGWHIDLSGSATSAVWTSAGTDMDFNDPTTSGCTDSADVGDTVGGQMTVDPSTGTVIQGQLENGTTGVTAGSSDDYEEGVTDDIAIMTGAAESEDIGDWYLTGATIHQTIPAEQPAASDYDIDMSLTITGA